jgi:hypothetical protein
VHRSSHTRWGLGRDYYKPSLTPAKCNAESSGGARNWSLCCHFKFDVKYICFYLFCIIFGNIYGCIQRILQNQVIRWLRHWQRGWFEPRTSWHKWGWLHHCARPALTTQERHDPLK